MARILLNSIDAIGTSMAGPGIRYWEFARALSTQHEVTLYCPNDPDLASTDFQVLSAQRVRLSAELRDAEVLVTQRLRPGVVTAARRNGTRIVVDAYDPILLELLEVHAHRQPSLQRKDNRRSWAETLLGMQVADAVVCASERQRDLWLGVLMSVDRIRPDLYRRDPLLRSLIDVVPFGFPDTRPVRTGSGCREQFDIAPQTPVLLWGGGVWNWFDPLTLIRAVDKLHRQGREVALVFMGMQRPLPNVVPEMEMARQARRLADELGATGHRVFFNEGWVPYADRQNYLLDADIGVSTHFEHVETRFAFRTRVLDYLWCDLPVIATRGDTLGDLVEARGLGRTVPPEDVDALAATIVDVLDRDGGLMRERIRAGAAAEFGWTQATAPLLRVIESVLAQQPRSLDLPQAVSAAHLYRALVGVVREQVGVVGLVRMQAPRLRRRG